MSEATKQRLRDPAFKYTKASESDIRKTFARIRRMLREGEAVKQSANVKQLRRGS